MTETPKCEWCGSVNDLVTLSNGVVLCHPCNRAWIAALIEVEFVREMGFDAE